MTQNTLIISQIPNFDVNINDQQLQYAIKEINLQLSYQQKEFDKIRKEISQKPSQTNISDCNVIINGEIDLDPLLLKLITKRNQKKKLPPQQTNLLKRSARELSKKVNGMSEAINILYQQLKNQQKKIQTLQADLPAKLNQKAKYLEKRIQDVIQDKFNENESLKQRIQTKNNQLLQNIKQLEKKTLWQINDCKNVLNSRINQQFVKDSIAQFQQKMINRMREYQIKSTIDPQRIIKLQNKFTKLDSQYNLFTVQQNHRFKNIIQKIDAELVKKVQYSQTSSAFDRRMAMMNATIAESSRKLIYAEQNQKQVDNTLRKMTQTNILFQKQFKRLNELVKNLKLGQEFQKMMENLDPHKICQIDNLLTVLTANDAKFDKDMDYLKKDVDKIRSKTNYIQSLRDQPANNKPKKQQVEQIISEMLNNNLYIKKILHMQSQLVDTKSNYQMLNNLDKRVSKLQKQNDIHNLIFQMKGLEQYAKKQILIMNAKLTQLDLIVKEEKKRPRPSSAGRNLDNSRVNSSINFKKLYPVNCIGCFNTPGIFSNEGVQSTSTKGKTITALLSSRQK